MVIKIKPILKPQNAFDATKEHEFEFSYPSIISKSKLIVYTNSNGKIVYEQTQTSSKKAYILKGERIRLGAVSAIHEIIDLEALKKESKKNKATITQYLASVLIYSIYEENYKNISPRMFKNGKLY